MATQTLGARRGPPAKRRCRRAAALDALVARRACRSSALLAGHPRRCRRAAAPRLGATVALVGTRRGPPADLHTGVSRGPPAPLPPCCSVSPRCHRNLGRRSPRSTRQAPLSPCCSASPRASPTVATGVFCLGPPCKDHVPHTFCTFRLCLARVWRVLYLCTCPARASRLAGFTRALPSVRRASHVVYVYHTSCTGHECPTHV